MTGAGGGIGRLMAQKLAEKGVTVVLWDMNAQAVKEAADEINKTRPNAAHSYEINLTNREAVYQLAARVQQEVGDVDILVNNAGIVTGKSLLESSDKQIELTMQVNCISHFWTLKAFLPSMLQNNRGHIVTVASSAGHVGVAGLVDYCASKHAAVGLDESLRMELKKQNKTGVFTTCVCPYYINTGMFDGVKTRFPWILPILTPEYAVKKIMSAILTNQEQLFMPRFLYLIYFVKALFPEALQDEMHKALGTSNSMDDFKGRNQKKE